MARSDLINHFIPLRRSFGLAKYRCIVSSRYKIPKMAVANPKILLFSKLKTSFPTVRRMREEAMAIDANVSVDVSLVASVRSLSFSCSLIHVPYNCQYRGLFELDWSNLLRKFRFACITERLRRTSKKKVRELRLHPSNPHLGHLTGHNTTLRDITNCARLVRYC